jgi:hypothetical protein
LRDHAVVGGRSQCVDVNEERRSVGLRRVAAADEGDAPTVEVGRAGEDVAGNRVGVPEVTVSSSARTTLLKPMDQPPSAEAGASGLDATVGGRRRRHHPHMPISRIANLTPGQLERQTMRRRRR